MKMIVLVCGCMAFGALTIGQIATAAEPNDFIDFSLRSGTTTLLPGRLYVPPEASLSPIQPRPFVVFLHGGGEAGYQ